MRVNRRPLSQEKLNVKTRKNRGCSWLLEDLLNTSIGSSSQFQSLQLGDENQGEVHLRKAGQCLQEERHKTSVSSHCICVMSVRCKWMVVVCALDSDGNIYIYNSSATQGGGGSFKNRKPIGELGCCESGMAERSH